MAYILLLISVLIGWVAVVLIHNAHKKISFLLAFSGAFLLSITIIHLLPEIFLNTNSENTSIYILAGILMQSLLQYITKGTEHGNFHKTDRYYFKGYNKFPWLLFIGLSLHALSEGLPLAHIDQEKHLLFYGILIHKIPIGILLTTLFLQRQYSKLHTFLWVALFSLISPLAVLLSDKIDFISEHHDQIMAFNIGVFLHVSTTILFENNNSAFKWAKFIAILFGMGLVLFIKYL